MGGYPDTQELASVDLGVSNQVIDYVVFSCYYENFGTLLLSY